jgi:hypothetical protein
MIEKMSSNDGSTRTIHVNVKNPRYINRRRDLQTTTDTTNSSQTLTQITGLPTVTSILDNKTNLSPILKQEITLQLSA